MTRSDEARWRAVLQVAEAVEEAVREAGPDGLPEGHLYAMLMPVMSLEVFRGIVDTFVSVGKFRRLPGPRVAWAAGGAS